MSIITVLDALALPANARVDQRIPKKLLVEQGAQTAADKRQIQDSFEELQWIAALKPATIGVPMFNNAEREYLEVAVLTAVFRPNAKVQRLTELIHRAIPYPVLLVSSHDDAGVDSISISAAHKRFAQKEEGKFVIEEILTTGQISVDAIPPPPIRAFLNSLALTRLSTRNLFMFYQGWLDSIVGLARSKITGQFTLPKSPEELHRMRESVATYLQIYDELSALRTQATKEKQLNRLVELNLSIKRLEAKLFKNQSEILGKPS